MSKIFYIICVFCCSLYFGQQNDLAVKSYLDAENAFNNDNYDLAISNLNIAESLLKGTNPKIQNLKLKSYRQSALKDSTKNYNSYKNYVSELNQKKSQLSNEAQAELKNFSADKLILSENKKNNLIASIDGIMIGQKFSEIKKELFSTIDFDKPVDENNAYHFLRKNKTPETQIGIYEIGVNKNDDMVRKVESVFKILTAENIMDASSIFSEKLSKFEKKDISESSKIEKINKKEYNVSTVIAKVDDKISYFIKTYIPTKIMKDKMFMTEGFEMK